MDAVTGIVGALTIIIIFGGPLILILGLVLGLRAMKNRHAERMALIGQGLIPPDTPTKRANPNRFVTLRNGITLISLAVGIVVGFLLPNLTGLSGGGFDIGDYRVQVETGGFFTVSASIAFFLGLGYLTYFFISRKIEKEEEENENDFPPFQQQ